MAPSRRKRKLAESTDRGPSRRARPPPLNPLPGRSNSAEKHVLLVHGAVDAGQLGLGDDQVKEVMRPRVHPSVQDLVVAGEMGPNGLEKVAAGGMHSLILDSNGKLWSFGLNDSLTLGRTTKAPDGNPENVPSLVSGLNGFRAATIAASDNLSIAISDEGELRAWGTFNSADGLLGFKASKDKAAVPTSLPAFKKLLICGAACGEDHVLALTCDGTVYAWGNGTNFQLGRKIMERRKVNGLKPEPVALPPIVAVFAGSHNSFAVDLHGVVFAWGLNQMRQTGISDVADGKNVQITSPTPVDALYPDKHGGARVIEIAGGEHHTLFLLDNGEVWVCGRSGADRLGLAADHPLVVDHNAEVDAFEGEETDRPRRDDFLVPEPIRLAFPPPSTPSHTAPELSPYAQGFSATRIAHISAGERYSLAVDESGVLYAWGEGNASQLGLGQVTNARTPTRVLNTALKAHQVTAVSAGGQHCLLLAVKQ